MNATKLIQNAIENKLNLSVKDYEVMFQARSWGECKTTTFDAAIIMVCESAEFYAIRAWHNKIYKAYKVHKSLRDAAINIMLLDD